MLVGLLTLAGVNIATASHDDNSQSTVRIEVANGIGSGVDIGDGIVITADHVVGNALTVTVKRENGDTENGTVLWTDKDHDVAAVSVKSGAAHSSLACHYTPKAGDEVEVVGNTMGFYFLHTWGHVAKNGYLLNDTNLPDWKSVMLVDVAAGPGNSGGPLYNSRHEVVGILVGGMVSPNGFVGIAFTVPSSVICKDMADHAPVS